MKKLLPVGLIATTLGLLLLVSATLSAPAEIPLQQATSTSTDTPMPTVTATITPTATSTTTPAATATLTPTPGPSPTPMCSAGATCCYTIKADNLTAPLKAFWGDYFRTPSDELCGQWPETGYVKLYDASGNLVDTRTYDYNGGQHGDSWAAQDWPYSDGAWWWYPSTPGRGNRIPPTPVPTVEPTPT